MATSSGKVALGGKGTRGEDAAAEVKLRRSGGASLWSAVAEGAQRSARPATPLSRRREMREDREVAASAKAVSALAPRSATALHKDTAAGRERWVEVAFFLISNGRVRSCDLSRRAAPAEAGFRRLKPPPRPPRRGLVVPQGRHFAGRHRLPIVSFVHARPKKSCPSCSSWQKMSLLHLICVLRVICGFLFFLRRVIPGTQTFFRGNLQMEA
jgi:hypothetical protein